MSTVLVERDGPVRTLTIDRAPVHNALNAAVLAELADAITAADADPGTRAVVLTGAGARAFSAGADLDELAGLPVTQAHETLRAGSRTLRLVETSRVPVIAAVGGLALGGGFELALACSFIVASERASFGLPESGLGLIPGYGGTQRLPRLVGRHVANYVMLTGERLDAAAAHACGLLPLPPTPADALRDTAHDLAQRIARRSPAAAAAVLSASVHAGDAPLEAGLALETALAALATGGPDAAEGIAAFREKRSPEFGGQA
ncbi:MAG TPA: enoyl-CoA hydratase/isomerase family protein [Pseudonocardia sp.]|nr:enoyl-CoA hydratase/isomerase family protein [Pseudonocardia sp.]